MENNEWLAVLISAMLIMGSTFAFLIKVLLDIKKEIQIVTTLIIPIERIRLEMKSLISDHKEQCRERRYLGVLKK